MCNNGELPPLVDAIPGNFFLTNSIFGIVWWIIQMFVFVSNVSTFKLQNVNNQETVPIAWMWDNLGNTKYGWTAFHYFLSFWLLMITHVLEFIGWFQFNDNTSYWVTWWIKYPGMWLNIIGLLLPIVFIIIQMELPLGEGGLGPISATNEFTYNAIYLLIVDIFIWLMSTTLHILLADRFICHVQAVEADLIEKKGGPCPVKRNFLMTDEEYEAACNEVALVK